MPHKVTVPERDGHLGVRLPLGGVPRCGGAADDDGRWAATFRGPGRAGNVFSIPLRLNQSHAHRHLSPGRGAARPEDGSHCPRRRPGE
jgi:hypothetical protein